MGFDLVKWVPAIATPTGPSSGTDPSVLIYGSGTSNDDFYNIPGSTKIDGTIDTTGPSRIDVGDSSIYSTPPTLSEVTLNSNSKGLNQIIALINYRTGILNSVWGSSLTYMSYLSSDQLIKASDITNISSAINTLRNREGFGAYAFPTAPVSGSAIFGSYIAHLRKALRISGILIQLFTIGTLNVNHARYKIYGRFDNPYNTPFSEFFTTGNVVQKLYDEIGGVMFRIRMLFQPRVLNWFTGGVNSINLNFYISDINTTLENFTALDLYSSNTDDSSLVLGSYSGIPYNLNNLEGSISRGSINIGAYNSFAIDQARFFSKYGTAFCTILGLTEELLGTGVSSSTFHNTAAQVSFGGLDYFDTNKAYLSLDFGT